MKDIKPWKRSCPPYIVLLCPVNLVLDFFIVEKTFAFYEKFLFSEKKTFAIFRFTIFEGRNFRENGQTSRKFLPAKVSAPKVDYILNEKFNP